MIAAQNRPQESSVLQIPVMTEGTADTPPPPMYSSFMASGNGDGKTGDGDGRTGDGDGRTGCSLMNVSPIC